MGLGNSLLNCKPSGVLGKPWGRAERGQNSAGGHQAPTGRWNSRTRELGLVGRVGDGGRLEAQGGPRGLSLDVETSPEGSGHSPGGFGQRRDPILCFRQLAMSFEARCRGLAGRDWGLGLAQGRGNAEG